MKNICLLILLLTAAAHSAEPLAAAAQADGQAAPLWDAKGGYVYPDAYFKAHPRLKTLWRRNIVPHVPKLPMHNWVKNRAGPASYMENITLNGKPYVQFWLCQPHNCADNKLYVLSDLQEIHAYHVYSITDPRTHETLRIETRLYGHPVIHELEHLKALYRAEFPESPIH